MNYKIVTDSSCGMSQEEAQKNNVKVIPLGVIFGDTTYRDGVDITADEFYSKLAKSKILPKTSQPTPAVFIEIFEAARDKKEDVIVITLSSGISGTYECAEMAKKIVGYNRVFIVDSLVTISAMNLLVHEAIKHQGEDAKNVADYLMELRHHIRIIGVIDTLEYLKKGGRVTKTAAFLGSLLKVKPLITFINGKIEVIGKSRGLPLAFQKVLDFVKQHPIDENYQVNFSYTDIDANCLILIDTLKKNLYIPNYTISQIGPVVGVHIGHRAAAIVYVSTDRVE